MKEWVREMSLNAYEFIMIVFALAGGFWAAGKYVLGKQERGDEAMQKKLDNHIQNVNKQISDVQKTYVHREEFEREMKRFNESLTAVRDEVVSSNAATSTAIASLTSRIDSWIMTQVSKENK